MAVGVSSGQFMMHILRDGKRRQHKEQENKTGRQTNSQSINAIHITHKSLDRVPQFQEFCQLNTTTDGQFVLFLNELYIF